MLYPRTGLLDRPRGLKVGSVIKDKMDDLLYLVIALHPRRTENRFLILGDQYGYDTNRGDQFSAMYWSKLERFEIVVK